MYLEPTRNSMQIDLPIIGGLWESIRMIKTKTFDAASSFTQFFQPQSKQQ